MLYGLIINNCRICEMFIKSLNHFSNALTNTMLLKAFKSIEHVIS